MPWASTAVPCARPSRRSRPPIASASARSCAVTDYGQLFRELAIPRLVGTPNHRQVRAVLKRELSARGFAVADHAFTGRPSRAFFGAPRLVQGVNLIAAPPSGRPTVWLVAHYDSKGQPISMALRLVGFGALVAGLPPPPLPPPVGAPLLGVGGAVAPCDPV